ncbi:DUF2651 family protein [Halobacillus sp. BBL2006]|uniref:DUF2651 family protein n=1 Tax=Halobacillus sp. BBL2006 TaxID=1543706 RepID=UPI0018CF4595|nr:DUF2651 family protein [Halobacillus sp. BBL2006]
MIQLVLFLFPVTSIILGLAGFYLFKNIWVMPLFVALVSITLMFTVFNPTFLMWVFIYTALAFSSGLFGKSFHLIVNRNRKG